MSRQRINAYQAVFRPALTRIHFARRTVFLGPLLFGMAILALFAIVPQMREIYLAIIEQRDVLGGLVGLFFIALLCMLLDSWQHILTTSAIDRVYSEHADIGLDRWLLLLGSCFSRAVGFMPLLGVGLGLGSLFLDAVETGEKFASIPQNATSPILTDFKTVQGLIPHFEFAVLAAAIIAAAMSSYLLGRYRKKLRQTAAAARSWRRIVIWSGLGFTVTAIVLPLAAPGYVVPAARLLGPLAMSAIVLIGFVVVLIHLSMASIRFRVPLTGFVMIGLIILTGWQIYDALNTHKKPFATQRSGPAPAGGQKEFKALFEQWWSARKQADFGEYAVRGQTYPVFIIAVQGGGIYAASAATQFLAGLQQNCPGFSQHVFAISAVSGGAVGATLFAAAQTGKALNTSIGCGGEGGEAFTDTENDIGKVDLTSASATTLRKIIRQDHLSPALALIWPDIARKFPLKFRARFDRSNVLERSFACASENPNDEWAWRACNVQESDAAPKLWLPFEKHWRATAAAPALVLNSTWVETGFRASFAPFPLHDISDGTLFSFHLSENGKKGDFADQGVTIDANSSLIEAAFVSARFPGIVPAWPLKGPRLWNFVDGGYVDNSGATTALELYEELRSLTADLPVSLHLILLTDADTSTDFSEVEDGTRLSDTVAPFTALLSVRNQLAGRAITRAIGRLQKDAPRDLLAGNSGPTRVLVVNLRQKTFQFALGWKISRLTDLVVRLMLGRAELCQAPLDDTLEAKSRDLWETVRTRRDNSCVRKRIQDLLSATPLPSTQSGSR